MHKNEIPQEYIDRILRRRGRLHIFDELGPANTALIVIDMQNAFVAPGAIAEVPTARGIVPNLNRLAAALRNEGGLVVWIQGMVRSSRGEWKLYLDNFEREETRQRWLDTLKPGNPGFDLWHELERHPDDLILCKDRYSAFFGPDDLDGKLRSRGIDTVLVTGTLTASCCESTARDAMQRDYRTIMVSDANAGRTDQEHLQTLCNIFNTFGDVMNTDEVIERIRQAKAA